MNSIELSQINRKEGGVINLALTTYTIVLNIKCFVLNIKY